MTNEEILAEAQRLYCYGSDDDIELGDPDDDLSEDNMFSRAERGTWVRLWGWVPLPGANEEESE